MPLCVREYRCSACGLRADRDVNAAKNILDRGSAVTGWDIGPESETVPDRPGAPGDARYPYVGGVPGQGAETYIELPAGRATGG